eukprot:6549469-Prymnesium_polylepis.1
MPRGSGGRRLPGRTRCGQRRPAGALWRPASRAPAPRWNGVLDLCWICETSAPPGAAHVKRSARIPGFLRGQTKALADAEIESF